MNKTSLRNGERALNDNAGWPLRAVTGYLLSPLQNKSERSEAKVKLKALFSSASVEWGTPPNLKRALDAEFHFDFDPSPPGGVWDGTYVSWAGKRVFCNPPYGRKIGDWLAKGREALLAVFLLPVRTDTAWFHEHVLTADEVRFFRGRLGFWKDHIGPTDHKTCCAPFPSMLVVFHNGAVAPAAREDNVRMSHDASND